MPDSTAWRIYELIKRSHSAKVTLVTILILVAGFSAVTGRAIAAPAGDVVVLLSLALVIAALVWTSTRLFVGDVPYRLPLIIGSLVLPMMLSGASLVAYPGSQSLSSADIQFLRAIEHLLADRPLAEEARLTLYPTSFGGLAALARLTGLEAIELMNWSWLVSMPLIIVGVGLFAGALAKSRIVGALAMVVMLGDPWHIVLPIYDGFNLVLLPFWGCQLLLVLRHHAKGHVVALTLLTAAIVTSHLFTSLFAVVMAAALMLNLELVERRSDSRSLPQRLSGAGDTAVRTMAIPLIAIAAWLVYVAERYLREGAALVLAFVAAFGRSGPSPGVVGLGLLGGHQLVILAVALFVDCVAAIAGMVWGVRRRHPRVLSAFVVALTAAPLVAWAIATPPEFSLGTDLKEWKVRPLFGAFVMVAPFLALGLWALGRMVPRRVAVVLGLGIAFMLVNAQTLSLTYGTLGIRTYYSGQHPTVVEDPALPSGQYAALGEYIRETIPPDTQLIADWRQSSWMTGVGGLETIPHYLSDALSDRQVVQTQMGSAAIQGIAVDRFLLELPTVYTGKKASQAVVRAIDAERLNRVFDSGDQLLYLKPLHSDR